MDLPDERLAMAAQQNCWEVHHCGREVGGSRVGEVSVCPAATETRLDGINHGLNGGRACWAVEGTSCHETLGAKFIDCLQCDFLLQVQDEETREFQLMHQPRRRLLG